MKLVNILLVEDNEGDILLTTEAFDDSKMANSITVIKDGAVAIDYLKTLNKQQATPDMIILDINLPKKNGHQVLQYIKTHDNLKQIPVIMLTTSLAEKDITSAYKNYANCYITKPIDVSDFMLAVTKIEDFWFNTASIPK